MVADEITRRKLEKPDEKKDVTKEIAQKTMTYLDHVYQHNDYNFSYGYRQNYRRSVGLKTPSSL